MNEEDSEKLRQEGREEVLDWLVSKGILNYTITEDFYFQWNWREDIMTQLPWKKSNKN